jgi:O-acetyl-ADP-ribose deacetylase (regulator of RNase III)
MIRFIRGDIFDTDVEVLVNPVNTVGTMGAGLARKFKKLYPLNFSLYREACGRNEVHIGRMFVISVPESPKFALRWIVNFPTKYLWSEPSELPWIVEGLKDLRTFLIDNDIKSIAIPALGCGLGGLKWDLVKQVIISELSSLETLILVFEP